MPQIKQRIEQVPIQYICNGCLVIGLKLWDIIKVVGSDAVF